MTIVRVILPTVKSRKYRNLYHTSNSKITQGNMQKHTTLSLRVKQPSISNFFETSQPLRKIKQLTSFWVKK